MKKILYFCFDLFIVVCFMLFGMTVASLHDYEIWHGALGGLVVHRLLTIILRNIRNYIF